jgi:hypothetical protein
MNQQPVRPTMLIVIVAGIALVLMLIGRNQNADWLIPAGAVLLGAAFVSPLGRFMQEDVFRSRIVGTHLAQQLGGRRFQITFGTAIAAAGICWWLLTLLMAAGS